METSTKERAMSTKPIVLATDGSPSAAEATLEAIALARALDTELVVVSVDHPVSVAGGAFYGYAEILAELRKAEHERTAKALSQACAAAADAGVECEPVHAGGDAVAADAICHAASSRSARMIVIGAHGWSPIKRVLHGSVSTAVVHEAHCPVLVVASGDVSMHAVEQLDLLVQAR
jgi:nucleotide-binding universal stress UspA family protein